MPLQDIKQIKRYGRTTWEQYSRIQTQFAGVKKAYKMAKYILSHTLKKTK